MATSRTKIANLALSHLGIGKTIANLETEQSAEAYACRDFFEDALEECLRDFRWPFATKFASLALVEEEPTTEWAFAYRYPSDCLALRRILSGLRVDHEDSAVPYRVGIDDQGQLIYTDMEEAQVEYTVLVNNPNRYPRDFVMALSFLLAAYIAPRVTNGDNHKLGDRALQLYAFQIQKAQANAFNEQQKDKDPTPDLIRARGD